MDKPEPILLLEKSTESDESIRQNLQPKLINPLVVLEDGRTVMDYLAGRGSYGNRFEHPLPILLAINLASPDPTTIELIGWCRHFYDAAVRSLLLVIVTHLLDTAVFREIYTLGADAYFSKPFDFAEFEDWIRSCQKLRIKTIPGGRYLEAVTGGGSIVRELPG